MLTADGDAGDNYTISSSGEYLFLCSRRVALNFAVFKSCDFGRFCLTRGMGGV